MEELEVGSMDYDDTTLPQPVREFRPVVYLDGSDYCRLLGPDPQDGFLDVELTTTPSTDSSANTAQQNRPPKTVNSLPAVAPILEFPIF